MTLARGARVSLLAEMDAWLAGAVGRVASLRPLAGGYSNDNALVVTEAGERYVLRRYRGHNACAVEAALARRLTGVVPVAEVVAADPSGERAGEPVLVCRFMPGTLVGDLLPGLAPAPASALGRAAGTALAAIGSVTFDRPGFFDAALVPGPPGLEPTGGLGEFVERCLGTGNAGAALSDAEQDGLRDLARRWEPGLASLHGSRQLVHADFNPKNLLASLVAGQWRISAVLDWEFAFSSSPLYDVGNMLRHERPAGFVNGFLAGYAENGGYLPPDWRQHSRALDLFSLADLLTRPADHRYFRKSVATIRRLLGEGDQVG